MSEHGVRQSLLLFAVFLVLVVCTSAAWAKRVDDVVVLKNGDRLTGEIKRLRRGELSFKAYYMAEAVRLDWADVERLVSKDRYLIQLTNGQLFSDFLELTSSRSDSYDNFVIGADKNPTTVNQLEVLRITPIESRFWSQLEGNVDVGFSFTSGNSQYQTQIGASVTYRKGDHSFTGNVDSSFSGQPKGSSSARNQFNFEYRKQLSPKWYLGALFDVLQSDQQSLDRRTTIGGVVGRNVRQTDQLTLSLFGGLAVARERYSITDGEPRTTSADAAAGIDFAIFRFTTTDIRVRVVSFPSLTTPGRMRVQADSDLRIKIAKDFYWGFNVYESFDSKPPVTANKNDVGVSTSLGWKF
jgi:putative salt-induced outer membrane protein YdiY